MFGDVDGDTGGAGNVPVWVSMSKSSMLYLFVTAVCSGAGLITVYIPVWSSLARNAPLP